MSLKQYGYKVYGDSYGWGKSAVKLTKDRKYVSDGRIELIESRNGNIYDGGYLKMSSVSQDVYACIYKKNNLIGPRLNISKDSYQYACSDGFNSYAGFRIEYKKGVYYIGYYNNGQFVGKMILLDENGKIIFAKANKYNSIVNKKTSNIKLTNIIKESNVNNRKVYYESTDHKGDTCAVIYEKYPEDNFVIRGRGIMRCQSFYNVLHASSLERMNDIYKSGYGKYHLNDQSFLLGFVNRKVIEGIKTLGFTGPCIYHKDSNNYMIGYFDKDVPNDLCFRADLKNNYYSLSTYKNGKINGISFDMNNEQLCIAIYLNDSIVSHSLYINSNMDLSLCQNDKVLNVERFPFDVKLDEIDEEVENNETLDFKASIKEVDKKLKEKYGCFEYEVEYEKIVNSNNLVYAKPKVKLLKLINPTYQIKIDEDVYEIAYDAFDYNNEIARKTNSVSFNSPHIKEIPFNFYYKLGCISYFSFDSKSQITKVCSKAFDVFSEEIRLPSSVKIVEKDAFTGCCNLKTLYVNYKCQVDPNAVPEGCIIIYEGAYTEEQKQIQNELNKVNSKIIKARQKEKKKKERKNALEDLIFDIKYHFKRKKDDSYIQDTKKTNSFLKLFESGQNIIGKVFSFIFVILQYTILLPIIIFKPIISLFKPDDDFEGGNAISILVIILGIVFLILGFCDQLMPLHDAFSNFANETVPSLFGFRITKAYTQLINYVKIDLEIGWLAFILTLLYVVVAPVNLLLNGGVLILVILCYLLYIIYGFLFLYGLGALLTISSIILIIKSESKTLPVIALIASIIVAVIYYMMFNTFYPV